MSPMPREVQVKEGELMGHTSVDVEIFLDEFSDEELMDEVNDRGLGHIGGIDFGDAPPFLREMVTDYLCAKIAGPEDLAAWIKSSSDR